MRSTGSIDPARIPVVAAQQVLIGRVALDDILEVLAQEMGMLAATIGRGMQRERDQRN